MTLVLRWRAPDPPIRTRWRYLDQAMAQAVARRTDMPLAAIIGPVGPQGPAGSGGGSGSVTRFDVSSAATWTVAHGLGRVPMAQVFIGAGEAVVPELAVDAVHVTVTFAQPQSGFVLVS